MSALRCQTYAAAYTKYTTAEAEHNEAQALLTTAKNANTQGVGHRGLVRLPVSGGAVAEHMRGVKMGGCSEWQRRERRVDDAVAEGPSFIVVCERPSREPNKPNRRWKTDCWTVLTQNSRRGWRRRTKHREGVTGNIYSYSRHILGQISRSASIQATTGVRSFRNPCRRNSLKHK